MSPSVCSIQHGYCVVIGVLYIYPRWKSCRLEELSPKVLTHGLLDVGQDVDLHCIREKRIYTNQHIGAWVALCLHSSKASALTYLAYYLVKQWLLREWGWANGNRYHKGPGTNMPCNPQRPCWRFSRVRKVDSVWQRSQLYRTYISRIYGLFPGSQGECFINEMRHSGSNSRTIGIALHFQSGIIWPVENCKNHMYRWHCVSWPVSSINIIPMHCV